MDIKKIAQEIKELKIQGARNIRNQAVKAIKDSIKKSKQTTFSGFKKELKGNLSLLFQSRPTEPGMQEAIRLVFEEANKSQKKDLKELKNWLVEFCNYYEKKRQKDAEKVAENALKIFPRKRKAIVLTHCHSKNVTNSLKLAHKKGKIKHVYCTETRPLFQGRITARELISYGITVTQITDSAAATILPKCNLFISGCDAIFANGNIVNKIGTKEISICAKELGIKHFVVTSSGKFAVQTFFGKPMSIEERSWKEVWPNKPSKLKIFNPAFDETPSQNVSKIISEKGNLKPKDFVKRMIKDLCLHKKKLKDFDLKFLLR